MAQNPLNFNNQTGLMLTKANTDLMLKLCEVMRANGTQLMGNLQKNVQACQTEFEANVRDSMKANNWTNMTMAWMNIPLLLMKHQAGQMQQILESSVRAQLQSSSVMKDAMSNWQKDAALAIQESSSSMPLSASLRAFMNGYSMPEPFKPLGSAEPSRNLPVAS